MRIAVIHHSFDLPGGGERMCMSLLRALDKTRHDTVLRCVVPPPGVGFAGGDDGSDGTACDATPSPSFSFGRVRLAVVPRVYAGGAGSMGGGGGGL